MEFEPSVLVFRDVRLSQVYSTSLCITNSYSTSVDFSIRCSSNRLSVTPSKVHLTPGQSIVVTVKLFLNHYPSQTREQIRQKPMDDYLMLKSSFFDLKVPIETYINSHPRSSSRSPSPLNRRKDGQNEAGQIIGELQMQIHSKDKRIKDMEEILGKLERKYPDLQDIIAARVQAERASFEEKSEKILAILKRKDEHIRELEEKVQAQDGLIGSYRQTYINRKEADHTQGPAPSASTIAGDKLSAENRRLSQDLQKAMDRAAKAEEELKLLQAEQSSGRSEDTLSSKLQQQTRELLSMREKVDDQAEQIEVLLAELSKHRDEDKDIVAKMQELEYLRREKQHLTRRLKEQEDKYSELNQSYHSLVNERSNAGLQALEALGKGYEDQVGGGIATSTPYHFDLPRASSSVPPHVGNLQSRCNELEMRLKDMSSEEIRLRKLLEEKEEAIRVLAQQKRAVENAASTKNSDAGERDKENIVPSVNQASRAERGQSVEDSRQTHDWWSYVWHHAQSLYMTHMSTAGGKEAGQAKAGDFEYEPHDSQDKDFHIHKLRENVKQMAIDLTVARQELLASRLTAKQETNGFKAQVSQLLNDNKMLLSSHNHSKSNKETLIKQLQSTIQILSSKSDMHMQIYQVSRELETEKLLNSNLQLDILKLNGIISDKNNQISLLEQEKLVLNQQLDSVDLIKTLHNIPGVHIYHAINLFAHEIATSKQKVDEYTRNISELQDQLKICQSQLESAGQQPKASNLAVNTTIDQEPNTKDANASILFSPVNPTLTNAQARSHLHNILASPSAAAPFSPTPGAASGAGRVVSSGPIKNIKVTEQTTVDGLLQAYDNSLLLNALRQYEVQLAQLEQDLQIYQDICCNTQNLDKYTLEQYNKIFLLVQQQGPNSATKQTDAIYNISLQSEQVAYDLLQQKFFLAEQELNQLQEKYRTLQQEHSVLEEDVLRYRTQAIAVSSASRIAHFEEQDQSSTTTLGNADSTGDVDSLSSRVKVLEMENKLLQDTIKTLTLPSKPAGGEEGPSGELPFVYHDVSSNQSFAVQLYIQRIIELTAEVSAYQRNTQLNEENMQDLKIKFNKLSKKYGKLNSITTMIEEENIKLKASFDKTAQDSFQKDVEMKKVYSKLQQDFQELQEQHNRLKYSHDHLAVSHQSLESKYQHLCSEYSQQLLHDVQLEIQSLKHIAPTNAPADSNEGSQDTPTAPDNPVVNIVQNLLMTWKEHYQVSSQSSVYLTQPKASASTATGLNSLYNSVLQNPSVATNKMKLNKNEVKYMQKIANLVLSCSQSIESYQEKYKALESQHKTLSQQYTFVNNLFGHVLQDYIHHKNVNQMLSSLQSLDKYNVQIEHAHQVRAFYQQKLNKYHTHLYRYVNEYNVLYKQFVQAQVANNMAEYKLSRQQKKLAAIEAKGNSMLQAKEYLVDQQSNHIQDVYRNVQTWFQKELASLLFHLPMQSTVQNFSQNNDLGYVQNNEALRNIYEKLFEQHDIQGNGGKVKLPNIATTSLNTDLIYTLCQSLCEYKSQLTLLEMQVYKVNKQNKILEDKLLDRDSVIDQYVRSDFHNSSCDKDDSRAKQTMKLMVSDAIANFFASQPRHQDLFEHKDGVEDTAHLIADSLYKVISAANYLHSDIGPRSADPQQEYSMDLEERNIELKHKNQRLLQSMQSYKQLVQQYQQVIQKNKQIYQNNVYKITYSLEKQYMDKLHGLQGYYEQERNLYLQELNHLSSALPNVNDNNAFDLSFGLKEPLGASQRPFDQNISIQQADVNLDPYIDQMSLQEKQTSVTESTSREIEGRTGDKEKGAEKNAFVFSANSSDDSLQANRDTTATAAAARPPDAAPAPPTSITAQLASSKADVSVSEQKDDHQSIKTSASPQPVPPEQLFKPTILSGPPSIAAPVPSVPPPPALSHSYPTFPTLPALPGVGGGLDDDYVDESKSVYLLRDLRQRVEHIQKEYEQRLHAERETFSVEKDRLEKEVKQYKEAAQKLDAVTGDSHRLRDTYEEVLRKLEAEYKEQGEQYRNEIKRLEEQLMKFSVQSSSNPPDLLLQSYFSDKLSLKEREVQRMSEAYQREVASLQGEFSRYKQVSQELIKTLEQQVEDFASQQSVSLSDIVNVPVHVSLIGGRGEGDNIGAAANNADREGEYRALDYKYRAKCAELDTVLQALQSIGDRSVVQGGDGGLGVNLHSQAQGHAPPRSSHGTGYGGGVRREVGTGYASESSEQGGQSHPYPPTPPPVEADSFMSQQSPYPDPYSNANANNVRSSLDAPTLRLHLVQARLAQAEKEISALQTALLTEKQYREKVKVEYEKLYGVYVKAKQDMEEAKKASGAGTGGIGTATDENATPASTANPAPTTKESWVQQAERFLRETTKDIPLPPQIGESDALKTYLRKVSAQRKEGRGLVTAFRTHMLECPLMDTPATAAHAQTHSAHTNQGPTLPPAQLLSQLREDIARKNKLLLAYRETRLSQSNALEQWQTEAKNLQKQVDKLKGILGERERVIRDLRGAAAGAGEAKVEAKSGVGVGGIGIGVSDGISEGEWKMKYKESELEKSRMKNRIQAMKDRISELESERDTLLKEVEALNKEAQRAEGLKTQLSRKDLIAEKLKAQLQQLAVERDGLKEEGARSRSNYDKTIRSLQRQLEAAERRGEENWGELQILRQRLVNAPGNAAPITTTGATASGDANRERAAAVARSANSGSNTGIRGVSSERSNMQVYDSMWGDEDEDEGKEGGNAGYLFSRDPPPPPPPPANPSSYPATNPPSLAHPRSLGGTSREIEEVLSALGGKATTTHTNMVSSPLPPPVPPALIPHQASHPMRHSTHTATPMPPESFSLSNVSTPSTATPSSVLGVEQRLRSLVQAALHSPLRK